MTRPYGVSAEVANVECVPCPVGHIGEWSTLRRTQARRHTTRYCRGCSGRNSVYKRFARYGITPEEYDAIFVVQNGLCAICNSKPLNVRGLFIDHDHSSGSVRGLLCAHCNLMVGVVEGNDYSRILEYLGMAKKAVAGKK